MKKLIMLYVLCLMSAFTFANARQTTLWGQDFSTLSTGYSTRRYWMVDSEGIISTKQTTAPTGFPFELVPVSDETAIREITNAKKGKGKCYDLSGRCVANDKWKNNNLPKGIYIIDGRKVVVK